MMNFRTLGAVVCGLVLFVGRVVVSGADANSATLQREWVRTYRLDAGKTNVSLKMLPVADGVVVAGVSAGPSGDLDYMVIKYKANGDEGWMRRFDAEAGTQDVLRDLAVDPMGNVFVTGTSKTVKYSRDGVFRWAAPFGGRAVAAGTNFVYVTGFSETNFATVQLRNNDTGGEQGWVRTFSGGRISISQLVALTDSEEILVAGAHTYDVLRGERARLRMLKYAVNGTERWLSSNPTGIPGAFDLSSAHALKIVVVPDGSSYLMGMDGFAEMVKFDSTGSTQWTAGMSVVEDAGTTALTPDHGTITVGTSVLKLSKDGYTNSWWYRFPNSATRLRGATVTPNGTIYTAGYETGTTGDINAVLVQIDPQGGLLSSNSFDSAHGGNDVANVVVAGQFGNIYVTGSSTTGVGGTEFFTIKYSPRSEIVSQGNGSALLRFHTKAGAPYALEATTNLLDWRSVMTNTADTNGLVQFQSADGGLVPYRFYRGRTTQ